MLLSGNTYWLFAGVLIAYAAMLLVVGFFAQRKVVDVEDYVLAGRELKTGLATLTMIATWFGAESLMTTTDEVAASGVRQALLDPVGISLCLLLASIGVAGPLWRLGLLTIPDFFRARYGRFAETLSACILVPSYFGWIAAQYLALGTLLEQFFGIPLTIGVLGVAALATGYSVMGGMWSVTWTDIIQMIVIVAGMLIMTFEILAELGHGQWIDGWSQLRTKSDPALWTIASGPQVNAQVLAAISAIAIGALGNLPVQDLMQRICSAASDRVAQRACMLAAGGYLAMGMLPILAGLAASQLLREVPSEGVMTALAHRLLSPALLLVFILAVISTVLSTVVSAVLAPASILSKNLLQPLASHWNLLQSPASQLAAQRACGLVVALASISVALSGSSSYTLVESSYSLSLVGLFAAFIIGLHWKQAPRTAALASMLVGVTFWLVHVVNGWDYFLQPLIPSDSTYLLIELLKVFPHELGDASLSIATFLILSGILVRKKAGL